MMLLFPVCCLFRFPLLRISDWFMKSFSCATTHASIYYCYCCRCRCCCYFYYSCSFSLADVHIDASLNTSHSKHGTVSNTSVCQLKICKCVADLLVCLFASIFFTNWFLIDRWKKFEYNWIIISKEIFSDMLTKTFSSTLFDMRHKLDVINHSISKELRTINFPFW